MANVKFIIRKLRGNKKDKVSRAIKKVARSPTSNRKQAKPSSFTIYEYWSKIVSLTTTGIAQKTSLNEETCRILTGLSQLFQANRAQAEFSIPETEKSKRQKIETLKF